MQQSFNSALVLRTHLSLSLSLSLSVSHILSLIAAKVAPNARSSELVP
jgi:hypothetical protein